MWKEFKEFALTGNVMDMAIGVIIGGAFGTIVASLVADIFNPILGLITGGVNFADLFISLNGEHYDTLAAAQEVGAPVLAYGNFIQTIIQFLILAFVVFLFVKALNKMRKPDPDEPATTKECPFCKSEIAIEAVRCPNCTSELPANIPDYPEQ